MRPIRIDAQIGLEAMIARRWNGDYGVWAVRVGWTFLAVALLAILHLVRLSMGLKDGSEAEPARELSMVWPEPADASTLDWTIVHDAGLAPPVQASDLARRFRLVGTFFEFAETANRLRTAIIEDLEGHSELLVSEGDAVGEARVLSIFRDRVVLRDASGDTELILSSGNGSAVGPRNEANPGQQPASAANVPPDAFGGRRIGEGRWVYSRTELLNYYQQLRDEPERLVGVFDSLVPLRDDVNDITGYQLSVRGEADFFRSVGMQSGDVVRRVNSVPMTNRRRAEFLISQFVNNRANAFVLEIERNGETQKLVYEIRE